MNTPHANPLPSRAALEAALASLREAGITPALLVAFEMAQGLEADASDRIANGLADEGHDARAELQTQIDDLLEDAYGVTEDLVRDFATTAEWYGFI